jgi:ribosomal protein S18 acetylase RimI-like enzyme
MHGAPFRLRRATRDDVAAVTACVCAAYLPWIAAVGRQPGPMLDDYAEVIGSHDVHVAERDGAIVGVLVLDVVDGGVFVDNVCVAPAAQRAGLGRLMLAFAEAEARRRGQAAIALSTHERMASNLALYARLGYVVVSRRTVDGYPRVFLRKPLAPA